MSTPPRRDEGAGVQGEVLEPGWLARTMADAEIRMRVDNDRNTLPRQFRDQFPLSWADAEALFTRMSTRFESWTGRSLADHAAARHSATPTPDQKDK